MSSDKDVLLANLRGLVVVLCRNRLWEIKGVHRHISLPNQKRTLWNLFVGSVDFALAPSHAKLLVKGFDVFAHAVDKHATIISADKDERTGKEALLLKPILHRQQGVDVAVGDSNNSNGQTITHQFLCAKSSSTNDTLVDQEDLWQILWETVEHMKLANGYAKEYLDEKKAGKTIDMEEYAQFVLEKMYIHLGGHASLKAASNANANTVVHKNTMPPTYMFHGFMAFLMFGPHPLSGDTMDVSSWGTMGHGGKRRKRGSVSTGRAAARKVARGSARPVSNRRNDMYQLLAIVQNLQENKESLEQERTMLMEEVKNGDDCPETKSELHIVEEQLAKATKDLERHQDQLYEYL